MTATATIPRPTRDSFEDRWRMLMRDVRRVGNQTGIRTANSERYDRANDALEELAAMLVDEVSDEEYDVSDGLGELMDRLWDDIEARMIAWAERVETRRAARREGVAA